MPGAVQHEHHHAIDIIDIFSRKPGGGDNRLNDPGTLLAIHIARVPPMSHAGKSVGGKLDMVSPT